MTWRAVRAFGARHRLALTLLASLTSTAVLGLLLYGRRDQFATALSSVALWVLGVTIAIHVLGLLSRSEAWHRTIEAAGGSVPRRVLYRASSMQVLGSIASPYLGAATRITALRRSSPEISPQVPTLIAAEFPIFAVEATLAALTSFTLIGPLGLPWWLPLLCIGAFGLFSAGMRQLALGKGRALWRGLAVVRSGRGGVALVGFVLIAVFAQIARNWILLHAVGVDASFLDAIAVLIAVVTLGQLPIGPTSGAAAAVLILGRDGVAEAAAAGVLLTVTGTIGGLCFAAWASGDGLWARLRGARSVRARHRRELVASGPPHRPSGGVSRRR